MPERFHLRIRTASGRVGQCKHKKWAVRIFSTEPPVLEYRRLGTVVLARQYCPICQLF